MELFLKELIIALSGLTIGLSLISIYGSFRRPYKAKTRMAWALDRSGLIIRVGLILILVYKGNNVSVTWESILYVIGLIASLIGIALLLRYKSP